MTYEIAIGKAWEELFKLNPPKNLSIKLLGDEYSIDLQAQRILSLSCNAPPKDYVAILILHYLVSKFKGLPMLTGEWLTFRELSGIEGYQSAFRQRIIERLIKKYGNDPEKLLFVLERFPGESVKKGDFGIILDVFEAVPILIEIWKADEDFGPDANLLFDRSITQIFCIEDIVVLAEFVVSQI